MSDLGKSSMAARRRWLGGRTLGVLGLTAALLAGAGMVRHAAADPLDDSATFNDPHSTDPNDPGNRAAIQTHVIQLIDNTPANATIRISTYLFASVTYRDALLAAHARGVNVQLLVDASLTHDTSGTSFFGLANGLGRDVSQPSFAVLCPAGRGCIGDGIDHDKFFLFSSTSGRSKVIVQTSANMIDHVDKGNSGLTSWNNAVTLVDEPVLYDAYGSPNQRLVWTGSYNYTTGALLHNDEALLKLWHHDAIFDAFQSNFQTLAAESYQTAQAGSCS